ncbi:hypothetical protein ZIOFF_056812 [Zingiber officinale]|uniref:Uncharacterized protein n=1 Tax=Zingiber officinale TaxID=94328 RepID=A0A8J5FEA8_ZINOF|nr:hypothetical protein ZIOFF_056812 [Zingiber officinale]
MILGALLELKEKPNQKAEAHLHQIILKALSSYTKQKLNKSMKKQSSDLDLTSSMKWKNSWARYKEKQPNKQSSHYNSAEKYTQLNFENTDDEAQEKIGTGTGYQRYNNKMTSWSKPFGS